MYHTDKGLGGLTPEERLYWSVSVLVGEVYNGGMDQFFWNSSGELFLDAAAGLKTLEANRALELFIKATTILFGEAIPPEDREKRWDIMRKFPEDNPPVALEWRRELEAIDQAFWKEDDCIREKLRQFAESKGLLNPFLHVERTDPSTSSG